VKYDLILAGVGGQGVLSVAAIIALGAMSDGLKVRQSEVHGMAQRGGAVQAHLRLSDRLIVSDLIGQASAQMVLSMEPLEALRYLSYLEVRGVLVSSADPLENISDYPQPEKIYSAIRALPRACLIEASALARQAGSSRCTNMVMVGAAAGYLPVKQESLIAAIEDFFARKGKNVVQRNLEAFRLGRQVGGSAG
jgi:indolepyruvate ferredoxin oxidoreductase beta subunit